MTAGDVLTRADHAARRQRLRSSLRGLPLLISSPVNVRYVSGFAGTAGHVLICQDPDDDRIITDDRYAERVAREVPDLRAVISRDPLGVALDGVAPGDGRTPHTDHGPRRDGSASRRLGVEADHLSWAVADRLRTRARDHDVELIGTTDVVAMLRIVKDDAEVERLAVAGELTVAAVDWLLDEVAAPGVTERQLAVALERRFVDLGADGVAFPSIVASGVNAAVPHHQPSDRPLAVGDVLTVDCGAQVDGYHADYTRTVGVGHLSAKLQEVYEVVRSAQAAGRAAAVEGVTAGEVDAAARDEVEAAGMGERFVHGTGHGIGLEIHEAPAVAANSREVLATGTTLTVEPGVYVPGLGGVRIEDTLVIGADGSARVLTESPRQLRLL